ncbi:MAG: alcohol dehydrogenase catalytic domain-containing protein [Planctomycetes bacterium]|nr:alcohol dehydrogenase catalytic domain-containing protein [Planctomycetota bacterium]
MLAATHTQGGTFAIENVAKPEIGDDEALLRVCAASICGTDVKIIRNGHRKLREGQRIVLGHEFAGVIEGLGSQVHGYRVGQRVGIAPNAGCGHCGACIRGQTNYCPEYTAFGIDRDGAHAAYVKIPGRFITQGNVIPLPEGVSNKVASLLEPFSCVVNGVRVSRIQFGDTVVIYGAGPMGLMHTMLCRVSGAAKLIVVDPIKERLEQAKALGCDLTLNPTKEDVPERLRHETEGRGVDVVITACPVAEVQTEAVQVLAPFGRVCLFGGLPNESGPTPMDANAIHYGNILVTGSTGGSVQDYRIALRLVAGGRVDLARIVSDAFALDDLDRAYETALAGAAGKVVLVAE